MKNITTRRLVLLAMLAALQVVLSKFLMVQATPSIRFSIDSAPILLAGLWFGPIGGAAVGVLGDMLGTILFPTAGAWYPPLTAAYLLIGLSAGIAGRLARKDGKLPEIAVMVVIAEGLGSLFCKTLALSWLRGIPFSVQLSARILPVLVNTALDVFVVFALNRLLKDKALAAPRAADAAEPAAAPVREMNYDEALDYIHHVTWRGSRLGLERTSELLERLGRPDRRLKFIHIAGTNGKGSTAAMLASILRQAGYRTGLYTSPYINRFNERMQVDGVPIADEELARLTGLLRPVADGMADHPTEFELITCIAMEYFARHDCDVVVLEVGMGGALDSTNVIDVPELAIITNIGLDHTRELGPTITDIANAKAGIIKENGDVVCYGQNAEADAVFARVCAEKHARLVFADHDAIQNVRASLEHLIFDYGEAKDLVCPLIGSYQAHNAALVLTAVSVLRKKGWRISESAAARGLGSVQWPARFEILSRNPLFIADGGHNPQGIEACMDSIRTLLPGAKLVFLLGIMADKDIPHMINQIGPYAQEFVTVTPGNPRAMPAPELAERLTALGCMATPADSVESGVDRAVQLAGPDGIVCALGSLYMLGDVRAHLLSVSSEKESK